MKMNYRSYAHRRNHNKWDKIGIFSALLFIAVISANIPNVLTPVSSNGVESSNNQYNNDDINSIDLSSTIPKIEEIPDFNEGKWSAITVNKGTNLTGIFRKVGVSASNLYDLTASESAKKQLASIYPGQKIRFKINNNNLEKMILETSDGKDLIIESSFSGLHAKYADQEIKTQLVAKEVFIDKSLYYSAKNSGVPHGVTMKLVDIFSYDIDFSYDVQPGDKVKIIYEEKFIEKDNKNIELIGPGEILATEFVNKGRNYTAIRYIDETGKPSYFNAEGDCLVKAFLRNPVKFSRISSHFSMRRKHPILHTIRAHKGVDYAAPTGTPIKATGDGKIVFIGNKGGYGRTVQIQHGKRYSTVYAHLSNYKKNIKIGQSVNQGDVIGYVGSSGLATSAHLHYEFRIDGIHHNPLTVKLPTGDGVNKNLKAKFEIHAKKMLNILKDQQLNIASK